MKHATIIFWLISQVLTLYIWAQSPLNSPVEAQLICPNTSIQAGKPFWVGVHLHIKDPWHVYWQNPGNIGLPPSIHWSLPEGFDVSDIFWSTPEKFEDLGATTYGYKEDVLLLVKMYPPASLHTQEASIKANVSWLACDELCIPGNAQLSLSLPIEATEKAGPDAPPFEETIAKLPSANPHWDVKVTYDSQAVEIIAHYLGDTLDLKDIYFFPNHEWLLAEPSQQANIKGNEVTLKLPINPESNEGEAPNQAIETVKGILKLSRQEGGRIIHEAIQVTVHAKPAILSSAPSQHQEAPPPAKLGYFFQALGFAFLGGLILNLMPCVFPVIGLKIMHLTKQAKEDPIHIKLHGLVFSTGILITFIALASLLIAFKEAGTQVGWGYQLQSPSFVTFLILLFFVLSLNFFGFFEWGYFLVGTGYRLEEKSGIWGSLFAGILATIVATPCTGPFMGVALGFALAQPPVQSLAIFSGLALGMASPYILLAFNPGWVRFLPKPGRWTLIIRQALAFPLLASVIWLIWVLGKQSSMDIAVGILFSLLLVTVGIWILHTFANKSYKPLIQLTSILFAIVLIIAGVTNAFALANKDRHSEEETSSWHWTAYSDETLNALLNDKHPVFIDFTAAWCLTCQTNKYTTLQHAEVIEAFRQKGVVTLLADWTHQDPEITEALTRYGRSGVPLYVFYPRGQTVNPVILPAILTPQIVLKILSQTQDLEEIH